ncbi:MAG: YkvA family protein [Ketobacter sp.]|uniref:YkvA family protein n=1 Tax=Ketobacter sp. MCCC 1A13808 TaxID=2602738 RepID=UPI0018DB78DD|nr:YkvA family protein [Ketobacter sp. MCCC 1A13808]
MPVKLSDYKSAFNPSRVMPKLNRVFASAGVGVVSRVLQLYYLAKSPNVPVWTKTAIFAALGYFLVTPDAIPDITPVLGFTDDLAVLTTVLSSLSVYITPEIRLKVSQRLRGWFGDSVQDEMTLIDPESPEKWSDSKT